MKQEQATNVREIVARAEEALAERFAAVDQIALGNQRRVLDVFREHRLTEEYFAERTGYGLDDAGREVIDKIYAGVFEAEAAAVRMQLVSGTHALACALGGNLRPGQRLVCLTGKPYDTLHDVIGIDSDEPGSLSSLGVTYLEADLDPRAERGYLKQEIEKLVAPPTTVVHLQKSRGYSFTRRTYSNAEIAVLISIVKECNPQCSVLVDNCYGEFVEGEEPTALGADLIAGSLIKNPGGGLAISGGYIAGKDRLVKAALNRITAPGVGGHQGLTFNQNRLLLQGLFLAPSVVSNAVKGSMLFAYVLNELGLAVRPQPQEPRYDIIQAIEFGTAERLINFCRALQRWSPVNAHVSPEPVAMPGYRDQVIMAGGTFIEGSTIELSADGPLRPPFAAFLQGGLTYLHVKCVIEEALSLSASGELPFT